MWTTWDLTKVTRKHNGRNIVSSTNGVGKITAQSVEWNWIIYFTCTKVNSKWPKELYMKPDYLLTELLEENFSSIFPDIVDGEDLLNRTSVAQFWRSTMNKWDTTEIKRCFLAKETAKEVKMKPIEWENILTCYTSDKVLTCREYK